MYFKSLKITIDELAVSCNYYNWLPFKWELWSKNDLISRERISFLKRDQFFSFRRTVNKNKKIRLSMTDSKRQTKITQNRRGYINSQKKLIEIISRSIFWWKTLSLESLPIRNWDVDLVSKILQCSGKIYYATKMHKYDEMHKILIKNRSFFWLKHFYVTLTIYALIFCLKTY